MNENSLYFIKIKIENKRFLKNEEFVIRRIALVVCGKDEFVRQRTAEEQSCGSSKWAINENSNEWWSQGIEEEGTLTLSYRYGQKEMMLGLQAFLEWLFH